MKALLRHTARALLPFALSLGVATALPTRTMAAEAPDRSSQAVLLWLDLEPLHGLDRRLLEAWPGSRLSPSPATLVHLSPREPALLDALATEVAHTQARLRAPAPDACGRSLADPLVSLEAADASLMLLDLDGGGEALADFWSLALCGPRPLKAEEIARAYALEGLRAFRDGGDPSLSFQAARSIRPSQPLPDWAHEPELHLAYRRAGAVASVRSQEIRCAPPGPSGWRLLIDGEPLPSYPVTRSYTNGPHYLQIVDGEDRPISAGLVRRDASPEVEDVTWPPAGLTPPSGRALLATVTDELRGASPARLTEPTRRALLGQGWRWVGFATPSEEGQGLRLSWGSAEGQVMEDVLTSRIPLESYPCVRRKVRHAGALAAGGIALGVTWGLLHATSQSAGISEPSQARALIGGSFGALGAGLAFTAGAGVTLAERCASPPLGGIEPTSDVQQPTGRER